MKKILILFFCSYIVIVSQTSTARFLYLQPSAEITSLGGAGVAILNNSFAAYYNPASFAYSKSFGIAASFEQQFPSFSNDAHSMITLSNPYDIGTVALTFNFFWLDPQIRTSEGGPQQIGLTYKNPELFSPIHSLIKLSYATKLLENFSIGAGIGLLNINHSKHPTGGETGSPNVSTVVFDLGFILDNLLTNLSYVEKTALTNSWFDLSEHRGISLGLSLMTLGTKVYFVDEKQADNLPSVLRVGFSYWPLFTDNISSRLLFEIEDRIFDSSGIDFIHLGNEFLIYKFFALRYGYNVNNFYSEGSFFTLGLGVKLKYLSFNVARYKKYITPTWNFDLKVIWEF